ncbi:MAG: cytochrome P450, partial [Candidatus Binatia bacterium]
PKGLADHEPRVREICVALIERARARGSFDFVADLAAWLPLIVIADMLGVEADAHADLLRWSETMIAASSTGTADPAVLGQASQSFLEYQAYQRGVIADRRAGPQRNDLVSILCRAEIDGDRLDDDSILYESLLILVGGDETTRHVLVGGMYELLMRPEARAALAADPRKIPIAVEEMLRWVSPIQNMARTATRDAEIEGQTIEAGDKVLLLFPAANRDPEVFPDPERFDVARTPNEHVAFGLGAHFCLGANLARMELVVMFEELLRRLPTLRLASDAQPPRRPSNFVSGIEALPVEIG